MKPPSFISIIQLAFIQLKLLGKAQADGRTIRKQSILPALLPEKRAGTAVTQLMGQSPKHIFVA